MASAVFILFVAFSDAIALLILRQWGTGAPWSRVDLFSGGYLALSTVMAVLQILFLGRIAPSRESFRIFTAHHIDPQWKYWILVLSLAEFVVFYDYGHLHLAPWLEREFLQGLGFGMSIVAIIWMGITWQYLSGRYETNRTGGGILMDGPYAAMRHPLYSALIATRIGFALLLASPIAWLLTALWIWRIRLRIRLEEAYLRREFGGLYDAYTARTPALVHTSLAQLFRRTPTS